MNGIENIIAKIDADRDAELAAINAESAAKCEEIRLECEKRAKDEYARILSKGVSDAAVRIERAGSVAALDAKKTVLAAKQEMVNLVFDRAAELLSGLPDGEYVAFLASLAARAAVTGTEKLILSPSDRTRHGKAVCMRANELLSQSGRPASLTLSERTADIRGGLLLLLDSGDVEVNCSIDALVKGQRHSMTVETAAVLFD